MGALTHESKGIYCGGGCAESPPLSRDGSGALSKSCVRVISSPWHYFRSHQVTSGSTEALQTDGAHIQINDWYVRIDILLLKFLLKRNLIIAISFLLLFADGEEFDY